MTPRAFAGGGQTIHEAAAIVLDVMLVGAALQCCSCRLPRTGREPEVSLGLFPEVGSLVTFQHDRAVEAGEPVVNHVVRGLGEECVDVRVCPPCVGMRTALSENLQELRAGR